jgi:hypothetical protein
MWLASAHLWSKLTSVTAQRSSRWGGATAGVYAGQAVAPGMKTCPCRWIRPTASPRSRKWPRPLAVSPPRRPGSRWSACARPASVGRADGTPRGSSRSPDSSTPPSAPAARTRPVHPVPRRRRGRPLLRQRLRPRDRASPPLPAPATARTTSAAAVPTPTPKSSRASRTQFPGSPPSWHRARPPDTPPTSTWTSGNCTTTQVSSPDTAPIAASKSTWHGFVKAMSASPDGLSTRVRALISGCLRMGPCRD